MLLKKHRNVADKTASELNLSRRVVLRAGAAAGGGLLLSFALPSFFTRTSVSAAEGNFAPNGFIRIGQDGRVAVIVSAGRDGARNIHVVSDAGRRGAGS